jgi:hypothetical protein
MRSALSKVLFALLVLAAIPAGTQINPSQIRWPANCNTAGSVYSPNTAAAHADSCVTITGTGLPVSNPQYVGVLQGPVVSASVNTQINVAAPPFSATGSCLIDDHDAIMAAQAAAELYAGPGTLPAALYFPKPPGGCYKTSTIDFHGVSMIGQPGGIGDLTSNKWTVAIRGMPGQDILHVADPSLQVTAKPYWHSWTIRDITFEVDGSGAPASFPHRWPGRWGDGVTTTAGSANIADNSMSISCGDVNQNIHIEGANIGGAGVNFLNTTIASVNPCWQSSVFGPGLNGWRVITLAATPQASITAAHTYITPLSIPLNANIGNCAIALDMYDANPADWPRANDNGMNNDEMTNVTFQGYGSTGTTCGMFSQGNQTPYQFNVEGSNYTTTLYGIVQGTSELNSAYASSGNDFQHWDHIWMFNLKYPWITYNGGANTLTNWQSTGSSGPQILQVGALNGDCACGWNINGGAAEVTGTNTGYGFRIEGSGNQLNGLALAAPGQTASINGTGIFGYASAGSGHVNITGSNIILNLGAGEANPTFFTDTGRGNVITGFYSGGSATRMQINYPVTMLPYKGETQIVGRKTADFIADGNYATPYNKGDLFFWPQDMIIGPGNGAPPYSTMYVSDSNSISGAEWMLNSGIFVLDFTQMPYTSLPEGGSGSRMIVGKNYPVGQSQIYYSALCPAGTTSFTFQVKTSTNAFLMSDTHACTTALQNYTGTFDTTSAVGHEIGFTNGLSTQMYVSWIALRPFMADLNGQAIGSSGGGIPNVQITTGTTPIAANTCTASTPTAMTGLLTTSTVIPPTPTSSTTGVVGWGSSGGLGFAYNVTAGTFNWSVCNGTAASITPGGSITWNVGAR